MTYLEALTIAIKALDDIMEETPSQTIADASNMLEDKKAELENESK